MSTTDISVIITSRNEGQNLVRTVRSLVPVLKNHQAEIVVVDDGSTDRSIEAVLAENESVRVIRHEISEGVSPSRAHGAREADGEVLLFLDAHVAFEPDGVDRLMNGIRASKNRAVLVPKITQFDVETWQPVKKRYGFGFELSLDKFQGRWLPLRDMTARTVGSEVYYESPTIVGCSMAIHRDAYFEVGGFDQTMRIWGMEDVDFGVRAWMMGHPVLCDPQAQIGHRFVTEFKSFESRQIDLAANQIRMARTIFEAETREAWLAMRGINPDGSSADPTWSSAWIQTLDDSPEWIQSAVRFREKRSIDEHDYAVRFGLQLAQA